MIMYTLQTVLVVILILPADVHYQLVVNFAFADHHAAGFADSERFGQQVHTRFEKIQEFFAQITARAQENFTGVRVVRAYAQEDAEIAAFNSSQLAIC